MLAIHDELGQVRGPRDAFYDAIDTSQGAYPGALSIVISTQAATDLDLLSVLIDDAKTGRDASVKLSLYSAPEEMDPYSDEALEAEKGEGTCLHRCWRHGCFLRQRTRTRREMR